MKSVYSILMLVSCSLPFFGQVAIGKTQAQPGVSLEFGEGNKGLILPWATNAAGVNLNANANQKGGAFILDVADRKVKMSRNSGTWVDLSVHTTETPATGGNVVIDNSLQTDATAIEQTNAKTQIGGNAVTDNTPGILVLADKSRAMIPPLVVSPELNIRTPAPGMIVFDPQKKLFCVFNGTVWSYWRAN